MWDLNSPNCITYICICKPRDSTEWEKKILKILVQQTNELPNYKNTNYRCATTIAGCHFVNFVWKLIFNSFRCNAFSFSSRTESEFRLPFPVFHFPFSISHFLQMLLPVGRLKKLANCEQRSQRPFRFEGNEACGQLKCLSEYANPIAVEAFSKGGRGRVSILTAKAKATEMSNTTLAPETRLFNRFSLRAMREMLLEADRETKDDGEGGAGW